ncbi:MAG: hypothetical protein K9I84_15380, partial [Leadbetterella sp.]|nr:hypothetical protein [Leadbetterella sp.]
MFHHNSYAQQALSPEDGLSIIEQSASRFPKFYREFNNLKQTDKKIKNFKFIRGNGHGNPASASNNGVITIDLSFIETSNPNFDDNRLVVVLYHELGHLYYFAEYKTTDNTEDNEKFAFEYSLKRTKELAENGDCLPLKTGLKFMKLRSQSDNIADEHVRAL